MTSAPIPLNLVAEDMLSETVLRVILRQIGRAYEPKTVYGRGGFGWIKKNVPGLNQAARGQPWLVLTDLDRCECAPLLIQNWLPVPQNPNLLFRVAVRQVESWILAHRKAFARFIGVPFSRIPEHTDSVENAKTFLIDLARRSRWNWVQEDIVPARNSTARQGPYYNERLNAFVQKQWKIQEAMRSSESLRRTVKALNSFTPFWPNPESQASGG